MEELILITLSPDIKAYYTEEVYSDGVQLLVTKEELITIMDLSYRNEVEIAIHTNKNIKD